MVSNRPRAWFIEFSVVLLAYGFKQCHSDHSLFEYEHQDTIILIPVYVGDLLVAGKNVTTINDVKAHLASHFKSKAYGRLEYFAGLKVFRSVEGIYLKERNHTLDLLLTWVFLQKISCCSNGTEPWLPCQ